MLRAVFVIGVSLLGLLPSASAAVFPLKIADNGRFLTDQKGEPFLVVGDTAWSLIVATHRRRNRPLPGGPPETRLQLDHCEPDRTQVLYRSTEDPGGARSLHAAGRFLDAKPGLL